MALIPMLCLLAAAPATPIEVCGEEVTTLDEAEFIAGIAELLPAIPILADCLRDDGCGVFAVELRIAEGGFEGVLGILDGGNID